MDYCLLALSAQESMNFKKKIQEFNKRWNIDDSFTYEEEFKKFKTRALNIFSDIDEHIAEKGVAQFCQVLGIAKQLDYDMYGNSSGDNIIRALVKENDEKRFYFLLQLIFYTPIQTYSGFGGSIEYSREILLRELADAIELSNINLAIITKGDEIILYPRGEKELDEKLVNEVLSFLNPESQKHFVDALHSYQKGLSKDAIKSAESIRRSIEEFLRFKMRNKKGLDANIKELQTRLKKDGRDPIVRNVITQTFFHLDQYFNENSKHKDGDINEAENEFLVYQAAVLMRYIDKII